VANTTLLIDSDIVAYKFASANQKNFDWDGDGDIVSHVADLEDVLPDVDQYLAELVSYLKADSFIVCLSCDSADNWRKDILPSYKENRSGTIKPQLLAPIKNAMRERYNCYERPRLEADDIMGILSTHPKLVEGKKIIVSEDKDMKTIPGWLYNPAKDLKPKFITEQTAHYWHLYQTLIGDTTDGYKGCPGIGPKKGDMWLSTPELGCHWDAVVAAYESKGLTEEDALVQARVARICHYTDYNFKTKEVIPWTP
jgi:DNA polymerase-1